MEESWWVVPLKGLIWAVAMVVIMGWLARSRQKTRPTAGPRILVYPTALLAVGMVCFLFFAGIEVASIIYGNHSVNIFTHAIFLSLAGLSIYLLIEYFVVRHEILDGGLDFRKFTGSRGSIRWADVTTIRYSRSFKWFTIKTANGPTARVSAMLLGLDLFAGAVLANVKRSAVDPETAEVLRAAASGNLPRIW